MERYDRDAQSADSRLFRYRPKHCLEDGNGRNPGLDAAPGFPSAYGISLAIINPCRGLGARQHGVDAARTGKLCRGRERTGGVKERGLMALLIAHSVEFSPIAVRRIVRIQPKTRGIFNFYADRSLWRIWLPHHCGAVYSRPCCGHVNRRRCRVGKIALPRRSGGAEPVAILPTRTTQGDATAWAKSPQATTPEPVWSKAILPTLRRSDVSGIWFNIRDNHCLCLSFSTSRTGVSGVSLPRRRANVSAPFSAQRPSTARSAYRSHAASHSPSE